MSSSHHDHPDLPPAWVNEVAEGIYAYIQPDGSWWINNTGFIVGDTVIRGEDYDSLTAAITAAEKKA